MPSSARSAKPLGSSLVDAEHQPRQRRRAEAALSMPSLASSSSRPLKASLAIRIETVKPMPAIAPPPRTDGPAYRRPDPAAADPRDEPGRARDADRFADHVADNDPERDRRAVGASTRKLPLITIPALASANSGTIT